MNYGRTPDILFQHADDVFHLAPIPLVYHRVQEAGLEEWHVQLMEEARIAFTEPALEVPDVRHINSMGAPPHFEDDNWSEEQIPAVGIWHSVPPNSYLTLQAACVRKLQTLIEERYLHALSICGFGHEHAPWISESWIQFYKSGDCKVLHNHERYGPPYPHNRWAGAYYIDDGDPDPSMPYSGALSFRVRQCNYYFRPRSGLLMIWPADILHEVHPFYGSRERVVVNFNINTREINGT